ncbi:Ig-like domain-containing protein [Alcanivoracaceae bacterium MT1]
MIRGTFNRTLYGTLLITACATVLTACGGSDGSDMPGNDANDSQRQSLLYAYPDDGQAEVPTKAPVVLRFTSDVSLGDVEQSVTLCCDAEGGNLDYTAETVGPDPRGVILTPAQSLSPLTDYTIAIKNLRLRNGTSADRTLRFTTRPLAEGPRSLVVKDDGFAIDRQMPNGDTNEPIMDFSSFRFQFTQPVDRASARYGDTVVLTDSSGETVEATLLINGHYMTVDPKPEYLTPGQSYTLSLTSGLTSTFDEAFAGTEISFTPADSSPRGEPAMLVQRITQSGLSRLTGKNINQVPVNGTLLGEDVNVTQASADAVVAELADVTEYPDVTPIRLPRGTKLTGSAIEMVMIGGEVPAGFGSGPVDMRLTSDATGYLVPNPYNVHNRADALRIVHLLMDVGIATEDPRANGGFTQDIMHIELVGVAEVDTEAGVLNLDAVGMVEPNILGQEYGHGLLSFQLQSYKDQMNAPTAPEDTTGPTLQSWTLGTDTLTGEDKSLLAKPGDPIILNFDEPIDPQSVEGNVTLYKTVNGGTEEEMPAHVYVDGAAIVVKPEEDLQYGLAEAPTSYRLVVGTGITDVNEMHLITELDQRFALSEQVDNTTARDNLVMFTIFDHHVANRTAEHSPILVSAYPGYPCALYEEFFSDLPTISPATPSPAFQTAMDSMRPALVRDLANNQAGVCAGGHPGLHKDETIGRPHDLEEMDDIIPVMNLPLNRPIVLYFSKPMDPDSFVLGQTFKVEQIDAQENVLKMIDGDLNIHGRELTFTPSVAWQEGSLYRYTLSSSGYQLAPPPTSPGGTLWGPQPDSNYVCGQDSICDIAGKPLQTLSLGLPNISTINADGSSTGNDRDYNIISVGSGMDAGGADIAQFFRGAPESNHVLQVLTSQPIADLNGNLMSERSNVGTASPEIAPGIPQGGPLVSPGIFSFDEDKQEYGPAGPLPSGSYDPIYDPDGLTPAPNSAKVLSRYRNVELEQELGLGEVGIFGLNNGCGWNTQMSPPFFLPMECPDQKFAYLLTSVVAEVTDEVTPQGLKVYLWPSQVLATSMDVYTLQQSQASSQGGIMTSVAGKTGIQIMRMRYNDGHDPVVGHIKEMGGEPVLEVSLNLYLDVPFLYDWGAGAPRNSSNGRSLPINMTLSGPIRFLDDGRMVVEQRNTQKVDFPIRMYGGASKVAGYADLFIPEEGSLLQYVSTPIK